MIEVINDKIVIIGTGRVGSTIAYTLLNHGVSTEMILIDRDSDLARGEALDLLHGSAFTPPVKINGGDYQDCKGAAIIIISAGLAQREGETRMDLAEKNTQVIEEIIQHILPYNRECILLIVTNPVDVLTFMAWRFSSFPKERVIGTGTLLDTSRLRSLLASSLEVDTRNVHGYVIGEHGDSEVIVWSSARIAGMGIKEYLLTSHSTLDFEIIEDEVREAAYKIISLKGSTYYAIALAVKRIVESILRNERSVLTITSIMERDAYYRINNTALSLPTIVGRRGIIRRLPITLKGEELERLRDSAKNIATSIEGLKAHPLRV